MRNRLLLVVGLGLLLGSAACTDPKGADPVAPPSTHPTAAAPADVALSKNSKAICAQAGRTGVTFGSNFIADLKLQLDARNKGAHAQAEAKQKTSQDVANYSYALADMAKLASDPALKSALNRMSKRITAFSGDVTKINATEMSKLSDTLDRACGKG